MGRCAKCDFDLSTRPTADFCPKCRTPADSFKCKSCTEVFPAPQRDGLWPGQCIKCAAAARCEQMRVEAQGHAESLRELQSAQQRGLAQVGELRTELARVQAKVEAAGDTGPGYRDDLGQATRLGSDLEARITDLERSKREQRQLLAELTALGDRLAEDHILQQAKPDVDDAVEMIRRTRGEFDAELGRLEEALREHVADLDERTQALAQRLSDVGMHVEQVSQLQLAQAARMEELDQVKGDHQRRLDELDELAAAQAAKLAELSGLKTTGLEGAHDAEVLRAQRLAELDDMKRRQELVMAGMEGAQAEQARVLERLDVLKRQAEGDADIQRIARDQFDDLSRQQTAKVAELEALDQRHGERMREIDAQEAEMRRVTNELAAHLGAIHEAARAAEQARQEFEQLKADWLSTFGPVPSGAPRAQGAVSLERPASAVINPKILEELAAIENPGAAFDGRVWSDRESEAATALTRDISLVAKDNKAVYRPGDKICLSFKCDHDCYLTVLDVGTSGKISRLFPNQWRRDNKMRAGEVHCLPCGQYPFEYVIGGPSGIETVKAIFTLDPVDITGTEGDQDQAFVDLSASGNTRDIEVVMAKIAQRVTDLPADRWATSTCEFFVNA